MGLKNNKPALIGSAPNMRPATIRNNYSLITDIYIYASLGLDELTNTDSVWLVAKMNFW